MMTGRTGKAGRPPAVRDRVVDHLRKLIVSGVVLPGNRLPTHKDLELRFDAESPTIRSAMSLLAEEGFIETRHRSGTFVAENPPHLNHYGLVFFNDSNKSFTGQAHSRYFQALMQAAVAFERRTGRRMLMFHGVDWHTDTPDRKRLTKLIETNSLAGVIFCNTPYFLLGSPILEIPGMPRVALEAESPHPNVRSVFFDYHGWSTKAIDYLISLGRRRVAIIEYSAAIGGTDGKSRADELSRSLAARDMIVYPRWRQIATMVQPEAARYAAELLMYDREPPDALLITDDNFVEPALVGLAAAGVRVPEDVAVVGHANLPLPPAKTMPVRLLAFDMNAALGVCTELIDRWRAGEEPPVMSTLPAVWDDEDKEIKEPMHFSEERRRYVGIK